MEIIEIEAAPISEDLRRDITVYLPKAAQQAMESESGETIQRITKKRLFPVAGLEALLYLYKCPNAF